MPPIRVLVVEDFEPFRQFIRTILEKRPGLQVVCESADGVEAVRQADEMKPDLIFLDVGLPKLNGLAAAQQIRKVSPDSKIVFVSQESSPDVVQEAFNVGARGYVRKTSAAVDLPAAVGAVLEGGQFVSSGLIPSDPATLRPCAF